jgi:hypothetical protein
MQTSLYSVTVPGFLKTLTKMSGILDKAVAFAAERGMPESELLEARLAPDMFTFTKQIQVACDNAKAFAARLNNADPISMEDNEASFADLKTRIAKTIEILNAVTPSEVDGHEDAQVTIKYFPGMYMTGFDYATEYLVPNFMFHCVTAYDILRMKGVPLGKADIAALSLKPLA